MLPKENVIIVRIVEGPQGIYANWRRLELSENKPYGTFQGIWALPQVQTKGNRSNTFGAYLSAMRQILVFFSLTLMFSCGSPSPSAVAPTGPGIYYWKTTWQLTPQAQAKLKAAGTRQLFLRLFDVDWDFNQQQARPKGMLQLPTPLQLDSTIAVTPVVFIVERVFRQNVDVEDLALRVSRTIKGMTTPHPALRTISRWQIDCDWTPTSRDRYFQFLRALQQLHPTITFNVTIRLHQYRERNENGVPPVAEGLLMCYNMEPVQKVNTANAIYREDLLKGYLKAPPYPLPLDAALPIFTWGAAYRDNRFLGIVPAPRPGYHYLEAGGSNRYLVLQDTTLEEVFVRAGDVIRFDGPADAAALRAAAKLLAEKPEINDLLLFDWEEDQVQSFELSEIWSAFYP